MGVKTKRTKNRVESPGKPFTLSLKCGGFDLRKEVFKGYIEMEEWSYRDIEGSFVVLRRDQVRARRSCKSRCLISFRAIPSAGDSFGKLLSIVKVPDLGF